MSATAAKARLASDDGPLRECAPADGSANPGGRTEPRRQPAPNLTTTALGLQEAILNRGARLGIIGLGYVGLPRIRTFIEAGYCTMGFDSDPNKIRLLCEGRSYIGHIPSQAVQQWVEQQTMEPTADMTRLSEADVVLICVPTPLSESRDPDLSCVERTAEAVAARLRPGQLIVLESTTYPGTTRQVVLPILDRSGLKVGVDFFLAYSPEREDPGNRRFPSSRIPKVVAGLEPLSAYLAQLVYEPVAAAVVSVSSVEVAEACKLVENTYRAVNIALVNELKVLLERMQIDVWEVIDAASTKPFGYQAFYPGPGLGGHCIPIDPFYLSWVARKHGLSTRFVELAGEINTRMPQRVAERVMTALNERGQSLKGSKIAILGIAYKKDVDDPRESPAFAVMNQLRAGGARLSYNDPHIARLPAMRGHELPALQSADLTADYLAGQDCVVILTDHSRYDYRFIVQHAPLVIDTRNATRGVQHGRNKIVQA